LLFAALLYPILASGYFVCEHIYQIRYNKTWEKTGPTYTSILYFGIGCLFISFALIYTALYIIHFNGGLPYSPLGEYQVHDKVLGLLINCVESSNFIWFMIFSTSTIFSAYLLFGLNYLGKLFVVLYKSFRYKISPINSSKYHQLLALRKAVKSSPFNALMLDAFMSQRHVLVTLDNDKVYVGLPEEFCEPESSNPLNTEEISILPLLSGYRSPGFRRTKFERYYPFVEEDECPLSIVIPRKNIVSISYFDFEKYMITNNIPLD